MKDDSKDNDSDSTDSVVDDWERYRRRYYIATAALRMFASGAEFSIISPSVWFYLKQFHAKHSFLGLVQASFQFSSILSAVAVGRIYDKTRRTKILALATNFGELIGNIVYSLGYSKYVLLIGRLICGLGEGFLPVVYAEVGSVIPSKERIKAISFMEGGRALGAMIGPVLNFAFMKVNFSIGTWHITYGSAAGLVMAIFWTMVQILTAIFIYDMYREKKLQKEKNDESRDFLLRATDEEAVEDSDDDQQKRSSDIKESVKELLALDIFAVMMVDFLFWMGQGVSSALVPLILVDDLGWGTAAVAGYYLGVCLLMMISLVLVQYLPPINGAMSLVMCCCMQALIESTRVVYQYERPNKKGMLIVILASSVVFALCAGPSIVFGRTLLTKLVTVKSQGLVQGVYTVWVAIALTIGPLLGSVVLYHLDIWGYAASVGYVLAAILLRYCKGRIDAKVEALEKSELDGKEQTEEVK